jgi:hypothetical protein
MVDTAKKQERTQSQRAHEREIESKTAALRTRKLLWDSYNKFVRAHGCWLVSPPGERHLRIEIPKQSALPSVLSKAGVVPRHVSTSVRIENGKFLAVDCIEITIG